MLVAFDKVIKTKAIALRPSRGISALLLDLINNSEFFIKETTDLLGSPYSNLISFSSRSSSMTGGSSYFSSSSSSLSLSELIYKLSCYLNFKLTLLNSCGLISPPDSYILTFSLTGLLTFTTGKKAGYFLSSSSLSDIFSS